MNNKKCKEIYLCEYMHNISLRIIIKIQEIFLCHSMEVGTGIKYNLWSQCKQKFINYMHW